MPAVRRSKRQSARQGQKVKQEEHDSETEEQLRGPAVSEPKAGRIVGMRSFPYTLPYKRLDVRQDPYLYRPGRGEQGVLMVEPYKSELLPLWKFKDPPTAQKSATELQARFDEYVEQGDFVGADMARKFIQMGFTRARRYANHAGGKKYKDLSKSDAAHGRRKEELPRLTVEDPVKAESARIFKGVLERVKGDQRYIKLQEEFEKRYADTPIPYFEDEAMPKK